MPGSPEILCSVVEKTGWGGVAEPAPQASRAAPRCWKTQGRLLLANFLPHSPPRLLQPPSLEGWEKERQFGDYQSHGFHFQGGGWGRLLPGGLSGPLPARLGQRVGLEAWAVGRGGGGGAGSGGGGAALTAPECFFPGPSGLAAPFSQAFPHHLRRISIPPCPAGTSRTGPRT